MNIKIFLSIKFLGLVPIKRTISEPSNFTNRVRSDKNMPINRSHGSLSHNLVSREQGGVRVAAPDTYSTASSTSSMSSSPFHSDSPLGTPNTNDRPDEQFPFFTGKRIFLTAQWRNE